MIEFTICLLKFAGLILFNLSVESLFPLFQRGNRLREQAVRGLNFSFRRNPVSFGYKRNGVVICQQQTLRKYKPHR